ncbi:hypothetical protein M2451_004079 [Dysgonomonas sp. PFB1-18]|uniref:T9SS type A sorting domain-containing protein n=1 Tax=unclassified Dysgonomonas TaxID=2630389 RepID=UPI0024746B36|nr:MULTISPECIES: T9SS type A sorting domain-containing protein [unclassified Dysgonomonas]MDH6310486.1 hypothetical protein [Dysgonomonas sp. PF1-14]MDH6340924.1 hypothetical protein [Dysgonomonas sp. PF1-16]MDH6382730.1 hypothetical protein [Dysgonomonas sp. PFB1-18]MDH6399881.1 hypothetical protein [Dysgonomonas sp. PF1-23]
MRTIISIFLMFYGVVVSAQINIRYNSPRPGDEIIKQQVEYKDPGRSGKDVIWDFSRLRTINDEYILSYSEPPMEGDSIYILGDNRYKKNKVADNELVIGTEHNTMYYYRLTNDSLLQMGHENPTVRLAYTTPMMPLHFPLNYGQQVGSSYKAKGMYSGTVPMQSEGTIITTADAYGKLILPSGDTLSPVLRVKTEQTIFDIPDKYSYNTDPDNNKGKLLETCRWYSKGYRYPVFETVRNINIADSTAIFSTAFFFPPQDHLYLDTDPENIALLDELWKETENNQNQTDTPDAKIVTLEDYMTCKMYPNPVTTLLNLDYELKQDAKVSFELYSIDGMPVKKISPKNQKAGFYNERIDCSGLYQRNYVLRITANKVFVNEVIIKK